ncbi:light-independent protochlorophyllide reductase subunit B [Ruminiclostridium hungatei]|uniref:Light-independent protochlorophyllide reductase subunit B n=1 Tax=Ruminiclostridium hungatei TaxID=48256 RepID=A0A1V4SHQ1_RUMHU|nr:nitrogenase component 1 [Ruminiclostridium hungatei]OPX43283.1 light-independent protochlorophyllide reductase subunit B [Ruminiclostridium hungatei]
MAEYIELNRNGCLLQGAVSVLKSINGVVPIVHSTAGCAAQEKYISNAADRYGDNYTIACTNIIEKQIVFGGSSRLREQIKNTVKVLEGELYVVVSGCAAEIVGDDIGAMTKEAAEQGYPVINISTPGFKGHSFDAYTKVARGIIEGLEKLQASEAAVEESLINIFGIAPNLDPYWEGNLEELHLLLEEAGFKANPLFGYGSSVENWKQIRNAGLNVAFTGWGLEIARYLKEKYNTPYIYIEETALGIEGVEEILEKLASVRSERQEQIEALLQQKRDKYLYYLSKLAPTYYRRHIQKEVVVVGPTYIAAPVASFLENSFGQIVKAIIFTDKAADFEKENISKKIKFETFFSEDGKRIQEKIRELSPEIILGSQLEAGAAKELEVPLLHISLPTEGSVILKRSLLGVDGGLAFLEAYSNAVLTVE